MESYREDLNIEDRRRLDRLAKEIQTLRRQVSAIRIERKKEELALLRAQLGVLGYLRNQSSPVDKERILKDVHLRQVTTESALHKLVQEGRVIRQGSGKSGAPFLYAAAGVSQ